MVARPDPDALFQDGGDRKSRFKRGLIVTRMVFGDAVFASDQKYSNFEYDTGEIAYFGNCTDTWLEGTGIPTADNETGFSSGASG